ncbi:thiamine ABC transporter substrate binding subunit [Kiloniella laminariae]|uniref:Thiamine ABC transporter substrate binding subunit n=1 Tax=Kiloniella laminariae TaxID=454162 RepID=A0ABT4LJQ1_9PROT|nr:thiamine ABC transporter substrate binding subunit [Kiloniella laminariae]MCZ4281334.1 thiamine ABC transporter substrate binding subunit [Kiloniella laminariae]
MILRTTMTAITAAALTLGLSLNASADEKKVLTVYTYDSFAAEWGAGPKVEEAFESVCNCDLKFVAVDSSVGLLSRLKLEGAESPADVVLGLDTNLTAEATATGLFAPSNLDQAKFSLPITWTDSHFIPFDYGYFAFVYDSEKLATVPGSLDQLINDNPDLKIIIQDPRSATPGLGLMLWIQKVYGDKAADAWKKLSPKIVTITKGWGEAYGLFLDGEADMVLSYTTSPAYHIIAEEKHQYKAAIFEEGHYMQVEVAGQLKNASEPELAQEFLSFISSESFQSQIPTGNWMYPVIDLGEKLPGTFNELAKPSKSLLYSPEDVQTHRQIWIDSWLSAVER